MAKNSWFAVVAILAIALGIGPNTAIFSIIHTVLLKPLPIHEADRVAMVWESTKQRGLDQIPVSGPTLLDWRRENRVFESMEPAFTIPEYGFNFTADGNPERVQAAKASANFFNVLGVRSAAGRFFREDEDRPGGAPVVLLGHSFWQRRFGGDPNVVGRGVGLDGISHTVVGVLTPGIEALSKVDVWVPIAVDLAQENRGHHNYGIMARMKPGVTPQQAQAEMSEIARRIEQRHPETNTGIGALVIPINELLRGRIRPALIVLFVAVGLLLLIACANVAGLLLARAASRQKEIAVRTALGASRAQVLRQLLVESVLLSVAGGALGLLLAGWCVQALRGVVPDAIPLLGGIGVDGPVLAFTLGVSVLTGILFGIVPAVRASNADLNPVLNSAGGKGLCGTGSQRLRAVLLAGEVGLALVLLVAAGLMIRSFLEVTGVNPGFRAENVLTMHLTLSGAHYGDDPARAQFCRNALERVETIPGVRSAAAINVLPMRGGVLDMRSSVNLFQVEGQPPAPVGQEPNADYRVVSPGFLETMGVALRAGRDFSERDTQDAPKVAIVNETLARRYFPNENPIGKRLLVTPDTGSPKQIVGVVADLRLYGLESRVEPAIYVPFDQDPARMMSLVVQAERNPTALANAVRQQILAVDAGQPVSDIRTMETVLADSLLLRRLSMWMLGIFAVLALTLATVGIYGLTSYSVSRRTHEIGLRMALGASQSSVLRMVMGGGMMVAVAGVALGLPAAVALSSLMRGLLYGVSAGDPLVFIAVPLLLIAAATLAGYIPARRATKVDPLVALRYE